MIVHLDSRTELFECLASLRSADRPDVDVLLVENGSRFPLDLDAVRAVEPRVAQILRSPVNRGFAAGANLGIRHALAHGAAHVLLLNDDALVSPAFLDLLLDAAAREARAAAVGPAIVTADGTETTWFAGAEFDPADGTMRTPGAGRPLAEAGAPRDSAYLTGCCVLLPASALERVGVLDERFFLYWEDADWGLRASAAGLRNVVVPAARIRHRVSVSAGGPHSPLKAYHRVRGHLLFAELHAPGALPGLRRRFARDVAWLAVRARGPRRWALAAAHVAALRDHRARRTDRGPQWLWSAA